MKHSKTPWTATHMVGPQFPLDGWMIKPAHDMPDFTPPSIAVVVETIGGRKNKKYQSPAQKANADRIIAAVNACEGISNKALREGVIEKMLDVVKIVADGNFNQTDCIARARRILDNNGVKL